MSASPTPQGYHSVTPSLTVRDVSQEEMDAAAKDWADSNS